MIESGANLATTVYIVGALTIMAMLIMQRDQSMGGGRVSSKLCNAMILASAVTCILSPLAFGTN